MSRTNIRLPAKWIELNITKTECATFLATPNDPTLCQCGRKKIDHGEFAKHQHRPETWSPRLHTKTFNTDAYGTILFEGEHHPNKARYVRLSYDTNPELIIQLMTYVWNLDMPQLLISICGGSSNFDLSPRLGKIFQTGIIKAARNTNAWIFSNGLNAGVAKHLGSALNNEKWIGGLRRGRVTAVGITSWGMVENREDLIGRNKERTYNPLDNTSKFLHLNPRHSNFLLVDNGCTGKFGGENYLRRRLEKCVSSNPISPNRGCDTPAVVIVLEGGFYTLRQVSDYLQDEPPIPVVVFAGTGRSADLISFVVRKVATEDDFNNRMKEKINQKIMQYFRVNNNQCSVLFKELRNIYRKKSLITVYNPNSANEEDFDATILSSIFRSQHWSPLQQLSLTLVWNRVDIAQSEVFVYGRDWSRDHLEQAMMEALVSNRLEFVSLLLEHGINMQTFLSASRLEALYSLERMQSKLLRSVLLEFSKTRVAKSKLKSTLKNAAYQRDLTLRDIGVACIAKYHTIISHMIGHVYQSPYIHIVAKIHKDHGGTADEQEIRAQTFLQPFDDLFIWAVLTKRHEMSKLLWRHGKGALAKALVAVKLNRYMASEINSAEKAFTTNLAEDFENYAEEWETLSMSLLDSCYRSNPKMARQLLTMQLDYWSKQTCLTLAVMANHRALLGHSCCQILLADLWMGALNIKSNTTLKIVLGILVPPMALCWQYKSTEELKLLPHQEKTAHSFGAFSEPEVHDTHPADQESFMKPTLANEPPSNHERTTDLAIVARSILPLTGDGNEVQENTSNENNEVIQSDQGYQFPVQVKVAEREKKPVTVMNMDNHEHFRFKMRSIAHPEGYVSDELSGKFERSSFVTTHQTLGCWRKFVEFQTAPITNYIRHTMGYLIFIVALLYVILYTQNPHSPGWVERYVIACFITQFLECIREFIHVDALNFSEKLSEMKGNAWQFGDLLAVSVSLGAVGLRLTGNFEYGMLIYRVSSIYWNLRLYKFLGVHRFLGPKIAMMQRMLTHMIHFSMIIFVVIITFGLATKAIRYPNTNPSFKDIAEAFLEPYKMMFGEVDDLDDLSSHCGQVDTDLNENDHECPPGYWIVPIAWIVYMLVSNVLIVNVLIAVFNGIYEEVDAVSLEVWLFQRFNSVMEFEQKPLLPPPFIIISHFISVMKCLHEMFLSCICEEELLLESQLDDDVLPHIIMGNDHSLKSFLSPEEQHMAFDFEEKNVDNLTPLLEKESTNGVSILMTSGNGFNTSGVSVDTAVGNRMGSGNDKSVVQQMKLLLGELHAELESQKGKLDRLINCWELDMANNGNTNDDVTEDEAIGKGAHCNFCNESNDVICSNGKTISTTSSIDEFS